MRGADAVELKKKGGSHGGKKKKRMTERNRQWSSRGGGTLVMRGVWRRNMENSTRNAKNKTKVQKGKHPRKGWKQG